MSRISLEEIKSELIGKTINWLTILDIYIIAVKYIEKYVYVDVNAAV